ncbi:hypothetical protein D3C84_1016570 [compost metagenome]
MARGRRLAFEVDTNEIEGQPALFVHGFGDDLQTQADQLRDQTTLGDFDLAPAVVILGKR